jgi:hypothetical protein
MNNYEVILSRIEGTENWKTEINCNNLPSRNVQELLYEGVREKIKLVENTESNLVQFTLRI